MKRNKIIPAVMAILLTPLFFVTCNKSSEQKGEDDNGVSLNDEDKNYMQKVAYANLGEADAGKIAEDKGSDKAVKDYGEMMSKDHNNAYDDLKKVAKDKDYTLPSETDAEHKELASILNNLKGREFDSVFIYKMIDGHSKVIDLMEREIADGKDLDVKNYASEKLATIKHHKMMADSIGSALFPAKP